MKPTVISDVELAFPAHVIGKLLPEWDTIPEEFRKDWSPWCRRVRALLAGEVTDYEFEPRESIDIQVAGRHLSACLRSFEPKFEHKVAGVAYLLSLWFKHEEDRPT